MYALRNSIYLLMLSLLATTSSVLAQTFTLVELPDPAEHSYKYCAVQIEDIHGCRGISDGFTSELGMTNDCSSLEGEGEVTKEICSSAEVTINFTRKENDALNWYAVTFRNEDGETGECELTSLEPGSWCEAAVGR